ncbi:MAG: 5-formyltetrahydrofolate cyclo-ligase [Lachnospiraceae bacterium]|nr:5-formyltetrahydrofolate cyclo-ligase [Lachnospiraceae bacterium]
MEEKREIRSELIKKRDAISASDWEDKSKAIQKTLITSSLYAQADCIMAYADFHGEVGTLMIVENALLEGKRVFLPRVLDNFTESRMEFYEITTTGELVKGYKGISEPIGNRQRVFNMKDFDGKTVLMMVPGVAFDKRNFRMGYGRGFYDIYLSNKPGIIKCGLCFSMQILDEIPVTENDIKMDICVSELTTKEELEEVSSRFLRK